MSVTHICDCVYRVSVHIHNDAQRMLEIEKILNDMEEEDSPWIDLFEWNRAMLITSFAYKFTILFATYECRDEFLRRANLKEA